MRNVLFVLMTCYILFSGCKKDAVENPVDLKKEYFPIKIGHWIEYQVDSIYWGGAQPADTFSIRVKMQIDSAFYDNSGRYLNRMIKYIKVGNIWHENEVHTVYCDNNGVEKFENNKRLLKLIFPVRKYKNWDMNAFNSADSVNVSYTAVDYPYMISNTNFDFCATVTIFDYSTLISIDFEEEIYAKNVGLIQRISNHLTTKTNGVIERGFKLKYTYLSSGAY